MYASVTRGKDRFMNSKDLLIDYLGLFSKKSYNQKSLQLIFDAIDSTKDGLISFEEFCAFEGLLCQPDSLYAATFQLFDRSGKGTVSFNDFKAVVQSTEAYSSIPFNFDCDFIRLHFSKDRTRAINYHEFSQLIHDFHDEHALQAFLKNDPQSTGTISAVDFHKIMQLLKSHQLSPFVNENLVATSVQNEHSKRVTYAYFLAFIALLNNLELFKQVYLTRTTGNRRVELTKEEFLSATKSLSQITPLQIDILFSLINFIRPDGRVAYRDLQYLFPIRFQDDRYISQSHSIQSVGTGRNTLLAVMEQAYRFALGAIAGSIGATAVYPIDLVKTRMQNQRTGSATGELMYKSSMDCFRKVIKFEGLTGLYRGLAPQLVGVAPEKAIKLTVNDAIKDLFASRNPKQDIPLWAEIIAGGSAGASQVVFTNPLEIVKIRLQVAGELASTKRISALHVIRDLGFFGLYKGSRACFLRDIPFSAIYFPAYTHLKASMADEHGYNSPVTLLASATLAGAPAASLTTPADVIKTRLQVIARQGQTSYTGVFDAAKKIYQEEGGRAFWKGAPARVLRSSPQFGVTLLVYEMLQRTFYVDFGGRQRAGSGNLTIQMEKLPSNPDHIGGFKFATQTFKGIETRLGISLPKYEISK
ncbi:Calcium-binding mitochondrial carrier protein Aralar1 [Cichlidogyrus casuarinus]|uniref:Calcium-binding mitochondrial carrier protein Aralar1 n=1 Tax=Cichlidogyrus casuarinus TaxID=1844966 RepID=A0ABD2Q7P0_9PLAT